MKQDKNKIPEYQHIKIFFTTLLQYSKKIIQRSCGLNNGVDCESSKFTTYQLTIKREQLKAAQLCDQ
ncbi:hypothetical protein ABF86_07550 [Nitrosomonas sp. GH22]|nr:hypothetical protein [Nitrosomonas sp. GH22]